MHILYIFWVKKTLKINLKLDQNLLMNLLRAKSSIQGSAMGLSQLQKNSYILKRPKSSIQESAVGLSPL